jgi:V/A-type H+-transporting ATPase subunit D
MWLRRRLATAGRGREQLDRKLRILVPELQRRHLHAERARADWVAACAEARTWLLRAVLLGGEDAVRGAVADRPAEVDISWATTMGLSFPAGVRVTLPDAAWATPAANAAVGPAARAFATALRAGAASAAADEAVRRVQAEIEVTRRRVRALDKRWLPFLESALAERELVLEQAEQEDGARLRRADRAQHERRDHR